MEDWGAVFLKVLGGFASVRIWIEDYGYSFRFDVGWDGLSPVRSGLQAVGPHKILRSEGTMKTDESVHIPEMKNEVNPILTGSILLC